MDVNTGGAAVVTGELRIRCVQIVAQMGAVKLEKLGMKTRGGSMRRRLALHYGLKPSIKHDALLAYMQAELDQHHKTLGIKVDTHA